MDLISLPDTMVKTVVTEIGNSAAFSLLFILAAISGIIYLIHYLRRPRFDPTLHMERPPIEQRSIRPLPPASSYRDWEREQDKDKDGIPWNR